MISASCAGFALAVNNHGRTTQCTAPASARQPPLTVARAHAVEGHCDTGRLKHEMETIAAASREQPAKPKRQKRQSASSRSPPPNSPDEQNEQTAPKRYNKETRNQL